MQTVETEQTTKPKNTFLRDSMKVNFGCSRFVFIFKRFVIKIPHPFGNDGLLGFYYGLYSNACESLYYKKVSKLSLNKRKRVSIPKLYFVSPFSFFLIEENCREITRKEYKSINKKNFMPKIYDWKIDNFGYSDKQKKIVCLDFSEEDLLKGI